MVFKELMGFDIRYFISDTGILKNEKGKVYAPFEQKQSFGYESMMCYKLLLNGKRTTRTITSLVNPKKKKPPRKQRREYPSTKDECIKNILNSITENNRHKTEKPNNIIVNYLNGNKNDIMKLYQDNLSWYKYNLNALAKYSLSKKVRNKVMESCKTIDDYVLEGFLHCIKKIESFRYNGGSFKGWSAKVILNYAREEYRQQANKMKWAKDNTFDYDKAWQEI